MASQHTKIDIPRSPVPTRRLSPSANIYTNTAGIHANVRSVSPTPARRNNGANVGDHEHATPVLPHARNRRDLHDDHHTTPDRMQLLVETDAIHQLPPLAGPEIDDLDERNGSIPLQHQPGVDDGLLEPGDVNSFGNNNNPDVTNGDIDRSVDVYDPDKDPEAAYDPEIPANDGQIPNGLSPRAGGDDPVPFPYPPDFAPGAVPRIIPDVNVYQQKKNLAQGMMDLALFSANANQLRYVWESYDNHPYFYPSVVFIVMSLLLQIGVGVGLIWNSRYNVKDQDDICKADRINNLTVIGIFLVTIVNVFIASFGVATMPQIISVAVPMAPAPAVAATG